MLGLPEPTAAEQASQLALAQPPLPPVVSGALAAAAAGVVDKAKPTERLDKTLGDLAPDWLTAAPSAIKARHTADEAETAAQKMGGLPKDKADQRTFALYTGGSVSPDGLNKRQYTNTPVWIVSYRNVPFTPAGAFGASTPVATTGTVYYLVNDTTGAAFTRYQVSTP
jgi:hypothetical protein